MKEEWRPIKGYENYMVSSLGRVKSLNYSNTRKERILKLHKTNAPKRKDQPYLRVSLSKDGKEKQYLVHRLVALTFLPNPNNYPCVNHKDENKFNNNVKNLEWISAKDNNNFGTRNKRSALHRFNHPKRSTKIKCLDLETNKETIYPSIHEAARQLNIKFQSIHHYLRKEKTYKNRYIFTEIEKEID